MRFFRRRLNPAVAVLLATAMQAALALGYAHTHAHGRVPGGTQAWAKGVASMACRAMVRPATGCPAPVPHDNRADCAACWSLAAAGVGLPPATSALALNAPKLAPPPPLRVAQALPDGGTAHFDARAPPSA